MGVDKTPGTKYLPSRVLGHTYWRYKYLFRPEKSTHAFGRIFAFSAILIVCGYIKKYVQYYRGYFYFEKVRVGEEIFVTRRLEIKITLSQTVKVAA